MNATSADTLGPKTMLDPFVAPAASVREPAARGCAFEKVLTEQPKEAAAEEPRRLEREAEAEEPSSPTAEDQASEEVTEEVVAQAEELDESSDESQDDEPAVVTEAIVAPVIVLPELPQVIEPVVESEVHADADAVPIAADIETQSGPQVVAAATNVVEVVAPVAEAGPAAAPSEGFSTSSQPGSDSSISIETTIPHDPSSVKTVNEFATALAEEPTDSRDDKSSGESTSELTGSEAVAKQPEIDLRAMQDAAIVTATTDQSKPEAAGITRSDASQSVSPVNPSSSQPTTRLPTEILVDAAARPAAAEQPVTVDSARLLHRVARAFAAAQDGSGEVRLRLSPPELGALRLDVRVQDGAMVARLETETSAARTALIDNLPALRERLSEQGVRIERFEVNLMQRDASGTPDRPADRQPPEQPVHQPAVRSRRLPQVAEGVVARSTQHTDHDLRRLNVVV